MSSVSGYGLIARQTGYAGLAYVYEAPGRWRFWDVTAPLDAGQIGAMYPTKDTLLADLHHFAAQRGYERAT
jgi:hypothetical protein